MFGWKRSAASPDPHPETPAEQAGVEVSQGDEVGSNDLTRLFQEIERLASRIYQAHGLPGQPGHYRRAHEGEAWTLISEKLTPSERFDLILKASDQASVQFAAYDRLGATHASPAVRQAAALLAATNGLRLKIDTGAPITAQILADAIQLGGLYQALSDAVSSD